MICSPVAVQAQNMDSNNNKAKNDGYLYHSTLSFYFCNSKTLSAEEICHRVCHIQA